MDACLFAIHFKKTSACSKMVWSLRLQIWELFSMVQQQQQQQLQVLWKCMTISSYLSKHGKNTLGSQNLDIYGGTNVIA